ncbi:MAG: hypothetical protein LAP40_10710 [Acidobacteriia bacterium]|nr:hypothetical protein [Terriglobia bacterium]
MKHFSGSFFCVCLLWFSIAPGRAQETPAQNPPDVSAPAPQGPTTLQPPPLPPRPPDQIMPDEGRWSVGVTGWIPFGHPVMDSIPVQNFNIFGQPIPYTGPSSRIQFQGKPKVAPGIELTASAGKRHVIRLSFWRAQASGNLTAPSDLLLWGGGYSKGDYLSTNYRLQNVKLSYEFLTWPYPIGSRKFRLKTLWQFQYTNMKTAFDAPLKSTDNGPNNTSGHKSLYAPTLGLGPTYYVTPQFRLELDGSGFAIPGHWYILDGDASASYRVGKVEVRIGAKAFRFRTSEKADYFLRGTMAGAYAGLRFYLN